MSKKISELKTKISNFEMSETLKVFFTSEIYKLDTEVTRWRRECYLLSKMNTELYKKLEELENQSSERL